MEEENNPNNIETEEEQPEVPVNKSSNKTKIIVLSCLVVFVCAVFLLTYNFGGNENNSNEEFYNTESTAESEYCYTEQESYEEREPYKEQEEYLKTEYYTETVPIDVEVPLKYDSERGTIYNCASIFDYYSCIDVAIMNLDTVGGIFKVKCKYRTLNDVMYDYEESYVKPGDISAVTCSMNLDKNEDVEITYEVTPPTKTIVEHKEVQRERQVTAYRLVTKYRMVTKYRTIEVCE